MQCALLLSQCLCEDSSKAACLVAHRLLGQLFADASSCVPFVYRISNAAFH